jgi:hypothetical protein
MKNSLLLAAALTGAAFATPAFADSAKKCSCPDCASAPHPVASSVVAPTGLPREFAGKTVNVEFTLDKAGHPTNIQVLWVRDATLERQLVAAFRQWRFDTGAGDPAPAQKRYILPLELTEA